MSPCHVGLYQRAGFRVYLPGDLLFVQFLPELDVIFFAHTAHELCSRGHQARETHGAERKLRDCGNQFRPIEKATGRLAGSVP